MSIDKSCGFFTLTCDNCGEELNESFFEFHEAVDAKKENGWKSRKVNGKWEDWCDVCCEG
jgi:hypothetical protein